MASNRRKVGFVNKNIHSCLSKLRGKFRETERSSIRSSNVHIYRIFDKTFVRFKLLCSSERCVSSKKRRWTFIFSVVSGIHVIRVASDTGEQMSYFESFQRGISYVVLFQRGIYIICVASGTDVIFWIVSERDFICSVVSERDFCNLRCFRHRCHILNCFREGFHM